MSALIVLLALSAPTQSESFVTHGAQVKAEDGLDLGGDIWIDSGYETLQQELDSEPDRDVVIMSGRLMLQARATYTIGDFFGQAQGQILAQVNELPGAEQLIDTDDAWIKF